MNQTTTETIPALCEQLATALQAQQLKLASAESCTGGLIAKTCTDLAGSSNWFEAAIVSYSNASKQRLLGVGEDLISAHGAVSEQVVLAMLQGLFVNTDADIGIAVSGIAGPGGGSEDKPVGTVWLSYGRRNAMPETRLLHLSGDRAQVRESTLITALKILIEKVEY
jgi:nicotinamide-nucleotide amidase